MVQDQDTRDFSVTFRKLMLAYLPPPPLLQLILIILTYVTGKSRIIGKLRDRDFLTSQPFLSQIASQFGIL